MKLHGVVKGKTIELATDPELPEGQPVLVELEIPTPELNADPLSDRDLENRIATDPGFEDIRQARALRATIATRLGGSLLNSVDLIREDRSR
jgi:hypothetical protein